VRRSSIVLAIVGVLLIAGAAVVKFAIVPMAGKLPSNLDVTLHYTGKGSGLDPAALASGDLSKALVRETDATLDRHVYVTDSNNNTAIVHDDSKLVVGSLLLAEGHIYAVDRDNRAQGTAFGDTAVEAQTDLTIALPIKPEPGDSYKIYDPPTQTSATLKYVGTEDRGGRSTNHYTAELSGPAKSPALTTNLPAALPKALASQLIPLLPANVQQAITPLAAKLPDPIPLTYTVTSKYEVWADTEIGAPVDSTIQRTIRAAAALGALSVPLLSVLDVSLAQTPESVQERADWAANRSRLLTLLSVWLPIALLVIGLALVVVAIIRRKPAAS
jgi:hypothetical protein